MLTAQTATPVDEFPIRSGFLSRSIGFRHSSFCYRGPSLRFLAFSHGLGREPPVAPRTPTIRCQHLRVLQAATYDGPLWVEHRPLNDLLRLFPPLRNRTELFRLTLVNNHLADSLRWHAAHVLETSRLLLAYRKRAENRAVSWDRISAAIQKTSSVFLGAYWGIGPERKCLTCCFYNSIIS